MVNFDAVIIGGSLAGTAAALSLATRGFNVALIDMKSHPKQKACGAGLSRQGLKALLGSDLRLANYQHRVLTGYAIHHYGKKPIRLASFDGIGISRSILDRVIFDALQNYPNLKILEGFMVRGVTRISKNFKVNFQAKDILTRSLILACGNNGTLLKECGVPVHDTGSSQIGASVEYDTVKPILDSYVNVHHLEKASICATPIGEQKMNLSWISHPNILSTRNEILNDLNSISSKYGIESKSRELLGASSICARKSPPFYNGIFVVGDAACQLDPIGGMGMTNAIQSGNYAAHALTEMLSQTEGGIAELSENSKVVECYMRRVNSLVSRNRRFTSLASWGVRCKWSHSFLEIAQSSRVIQKMMVSIHSSSSVRN